MAKKKERNPRHLSAPRKFPCKCPSGTTPGEATRVLRKTNGLRICECGRAWRLAWQQIGQQRVEARTEEEKGEVVI